ncbi:MAG: FtsB family cell division protein [Christensenellales bacterium]|jgi:cell division protein FtsB
MAVRRRKIRITKKTLVLLFSALTVVLVVQFVRLEGQLKAQQQSMSELNQQITQAKLDNDALEEQLAAADSQEAIEQKAREQLGWVKEDELLFVIGDGQE